MFEKLFYSLIVVIAVAMITLSYAVTDSLVSYGAESVYYNQPVWLPTFFSALAGGVCGMVIIMWGRS